MTGLRRHRAVGVDWLLGRRVDGWACLMGLSDGEGQAERAVCKYGMLVGEDSFTGMPIIYFTFLAPLAPCCSVLFLWFA